jgi:hypothetical protein
VTTGQAAHKGIDKTLYDIVGGWYDGVHLSLLLQSPGENIGDPYFSHLNQFTRTAQGFVEEHTLYGYGRTEADGGIYTDYAIDRLEGTGGKPLPPVAPEAAVPAPEAPERISKLVLGKWTVTEREGPDNSPRVGTVAKLTEDGYGFQLQFEGGDYSWSLTPERIRGRRTGRQPIRLVSLPGEHPEISFTLRPDGKSAEFRFQREGRPAKRCVLVRAAPDQ